MASCCTLYDLSINAVVKNHEFLLRSIRELPGHLKCDVYRKMYDRGQIKPLSSELLRLDNVIPLARANEKRLQLYKPLQHLLDNGINVAFILNEKFNACVQSFLRLRNWEACERFVPYGISLGNFFVEMGWYCGADKIFNCVLMLCKALTPVPYKIVLLCHVRLMYIRAASCQFCMAKDSYEKAVELASHLESSSTIDVNWATIALGKCQLWFAMNHYREAYQASLKLLPKVTSRLHPKTIIEILRIASKACVVKRKFRKAASLITYAVALSKERYGEEHPISASCLVDYGFYLLNVDSVDSAVKVYEDVLKIRQNLFGGSNLTVAMAHEDLAYALYVNEYSTGDFDRARCHAQMAINIFLKLLPPDHLHLASANRVKALILEEIAIDLDLEKEKLNEALKLHLSSLFLARRAFGEDNVQIAKHFGNLGRLYQSMKRFREAEQMHMRAIDIKERLLGAQDFEVALSLGHLASLYSYDMNMFQKAEKLYIRSIAIGRMLFGDGYSGLEYDYRGLIHIYKSTGNFEAMLNYSHVLDRWHELRKNKSDSEVNANVNTLQHENKTTEIIIREFFEKMD
ncbi:amyloid protein-binding protein 2-like [Xenia sp. Carnegie-2017]|uniref:amyloid protein-binding protein 2-like n=1 Tax=Xenia sp. Carnegie-2017 TaxID=2897299 RepID=UPI001F04359B|nr:amyloid protein-binding protein 2-like [Xenia sp. Carnegie-2017]